MTLATRREDEGKKLVEVADKNDTKTEAGIQAEQEIRRRSQKPPVLVERNGTPVTVEPNQTEQNQTNNPQQTQPQEPKLIPRSQATPR